jgi:hypothetical protein
MKSHSVEVSKFREFRGIQGGKPIENPAQALQIQSLDPLEMWSDLILIWSGGGRPGPGRNSILMERSTSSVPDRRKTEHTISS